MLLIFFRPFYSVTAAKLVYSILELKVAKAAHHSHGSPAMTL